MKHEALKHDKIINYPQNKEDNTPSISSSNYQREAQLEVFVIDLILF